MKFDLSHLSNADHDVFIRGWMDARAGCAWVPYAPTLWKLGHLTWRMHHVH